MKLILFIKKTLFVQRIHALWLCCMIVYFGFALYVLNIFVFYGSVLLLCNEFLHYDCILWVFFFCMKHYGRIL